jgi:hypothetical protein
MFAVLLLAEKDIPAPINSTYPYDSIHEGMMTLNA